MFGHQPSTGFALPYPDRPRSRRQMHGRPGGGPSTPHGRGPTGSLGSGWRGGNRTRGGGVSTRIHVRSRRKRVMRSEQSRLIGLSRLPRLSTIRPHRPRAYFVEPMRSHRPPEHFRPVRAEQRRKRPQPDAGGAPGRMPARRVPAAGPGLGRCARAGGAFPRSPDRRLACSLSGSDRIRVVSVSGSARIARPEQACPTPGMPNHRRAGRFPRRDGARVPRDGLSGLRCRVGVGENRPEESSPRSGSRSIGGAAATKVPRIRSGNNRGFSGRQGRAAPRTGSASIPHQHRHAGMVSGTGAAAGRFDPCVVERESPEHRGR